MPSTTMTWKPTRRSLWNPDKLHEQWRTAAACSGHHPRGISRVYANETENISDEQLLEQLPSFER